MFRRFFGWFFKRYQLMVLEPGDGRKVRNLHVRPAGLMLIILAISLGSAAMVRFYAPSQTGEKLSARYYQLQQRQQTLRDRLATLNGEFTLAKEKVDGLKNELLSSQQHNEVLKQKLGIYVSILKARKSGEVRILRATARMQDPTTLNYSIVLVKGGNYPRSVSGSIRITALGDKGQEVLLRLGKNTDELPYRMDTHIFLDGEIPWHQEWQPSMLHITRMNVKGAKRDEIEVELKNDAVEINTSKQAGTNGEKGGK